MLYCKTPERIEHHWPSHTHNHYEIMVVVDGKGSFYSNGRKWDIEVGNIFIAPPQVEHETKSDGNRGYRIISIGGYFDAFLSLDDIYMVRDNEYGEGRMLAEAILRNVYSNEDYAQSLCRALIRFLLIGIKSQPVICAVINKITGEIEKNFANPDFKVTSLLTESGYAEDYIRMKFGEVTGMTPIKYLNTIRMKNAKMLLTLYDFPISEVGIRCGILDNARFSRLFKSLFGISPMHYRDSFKLS